MSRIGRQPVLIPQGVTVALENNMIEVKGPKGHLRRTLPQGVQIERQSDTLVVLPPKIHALYGTSRSLVANMVKGVVEPFTKSLEINGVGYRAALQGGNLAINLGFSHPVIFEAPAGIVLSVDPKQTLVTISGADKELVGNIAARIRDLRPVEPYQGKGIRYKGEVIQKKAGKAAAAAGAPAGAAPSSAGGKK